MINIDPILYIGISQSFFSGLIISTKKPISISDRLTAAWLFLICIELLFALLNRNLVEIYSFPFVAFTYGPLLFLYVKYMTNPEKEFNWLNLLHFIPFTGFFIVSVIFRREPLVGNLENFFVPDRLISLRIIYSISFFLSITLYSYFTYLEIRKHQSNLKNLISYTSSLVTLNWLKVICISFYSVYLVMFIMGGLDIIDSLIPFDPYQITYGLIALFSFIYSFYSIKQSTIYGEKLEHAKKDQEKYVKSGLKDDQAKEYLEKLISYVESDKPYLDPSLTINDLSRMTGIPRHYITQVLNEYHGRNFFTFINEYRVKEVIERFSEPKYNRYTILAIAFDSGFNSKAAFNSIFKSQTGLTPSEFRENIRRKV